MTIVTSFYTPEWKYPEYATQLSLDCERLGLDYHIVEKKSYDDYRKNCNIKPLFIRETLEKFKKPIFWMDVDGGIITKPDLLFSDDIMNYDIAANRSVNQADRIHVGSIWFNYSKRTTKFVNAWCDEIAKGGIDDGIFNIVWKRFSEELKLFELPSNYFVLLKIPGEPIPEDACIIHRLSDSLLKSKHKQRRKK